MPTKAVAKTRPIKIKDFFIESLKKYNSNIGCLVKMILIRKLKNDQKIIDLIQF